MIDQYFTKSGAGWILSLAVDEESNWGDVEKFYQDIETDSTYERTAEYIVVKSDVTLNGRKDKIKTRDNQKPLVGDGLAFYHSYRAKNKKQQNKSQISLIGQIVNISWGNKRITIETKVPRLVLSKMKENPIIREGEYKEILESCGITAGIPYTLYFANIFNWKRLITSSSNEQ